MRHDWLTRPHRATLASVVANSNDKIKLYVLKLFPRFTASFRGIDVVHVLQNLNGQGIHFPGWKCSCTEHLEASSTQPPQQVLANDTASRIARAQKQKLVGSDFHYLLSRVGINQRNKTVATIPPASWARTKPGASTGRIPAKVSLSERATVTAGLANEVEAVNQYAELM